MPTAAERVSDFFFLKREREKGREREKSNVVFDLTFLFSTFNFFFFFFFNTVSQPEIEGLYRRFRAGLAIERAGLAFRRRRPLAASWHVLASLALVPFGNFAFANVVAPRLRLVR